MIYGLNFNGRPIPVLIKRKFAEYKKLPNMGRGQYARLVGVGQSEDERDQMLSQADNGHRHLHVEIRRTTAGNWYGIYFY